MNGSQLFNSFKKELKLSAKTKILCIDQSIKLRNFIDKEHWFIHAFISSNTEWSNILLRKESV